MVYWLAALLVGYLAHMMVAQKVALKVGATAVRKDNSKAVHWVA